MPLSTRYSATTSTSATTTFSYTWAYDNWGQVTLKQMQPIPQTPDEKWREQCDRAIRTITALQTKIEARENYMERWANEKEAARSDRLDYWRGWQAEIEKLEARLATELETLALLGAEKSANFAHSGATPSVAPSVLTGGS